MINDMIAVLEKFDAESWLQTMPEYKQQMVASMYENLGDYEKVAQELLCVINNNTAPFGALPPKTPKFDLILNELEAFLRGDPKYKNEFTAILADKNIVQYSIVAYISQCIAPAVGSASAFISPIIGIILFTAAKMGINAWLESREEKKKRNNNSTN